MKAIIKRNLKNYLKNPIFWIGLIVVLISMYQTLAPYLSIHYVKSDETFRKVKMASDGDVMEGCIPATPDKERELWEKEIVKILQDTENGFGMSEVEAEAVISEMKQMKITEACQYLKTEYHFNGANYVYEDVSWYQGSPEEVNRYIRENLEKHPFSYYFGRKFTDFASLHMAFFAPVRLILAPGETIKIPTGIRVEMEPEWVLKCYPRSGLGFKYRLQLNNTVGIIDSDYFYSDNEGHMFSKITNDTNEEKTIDIAQGEGFMQGIFVEYGITLDDDVTDVRNGGFGSTTK